MQINTLNKELVIVGVMIGLADVSFEIHNYIYQRSSSTRLGHLNSQVRKSKSQYLVTIDMILQDCIKVFMVLYGMQLQPIVEVDCSFYKSKPSSQLSSSFTRHTPTQQSHTLIVKQSEQQRQYHVMLKMTNLIVYHIKFE